MRKPFAEYVEEHYGVDPVLIACGLPATNKTETMEVVSRIKGYTILRTDLIRKEILKDEDIFDERVASSMDKRELVYDEMFRLADMHSQIPGGIILDATFVTQSLRRRAAEVAANHGKTFVIQQTQCPKEISIQRISKRSKENYESNALTEQAYLNNLNKFEKIDLNDLKGLYPGLQIEHLLVDTTSDLEEEWFVINRVTR